MRYFKDFFPVLLLCLLISCNGRTSEAIRVEDAWVRAAAMAADEQGEMSHMGGSTSAAYMTLRNTTSEADRLLSASSDVAHSVELHTSEEVDGVMTMHPIEGVDVPAGGSAELAPGGMHVMLVGLTRDLKAGEKITFTLDFEKAGEIQVEAEVRAP